MAIRYHSTPFDDEFSKFFDVRAVSTTPRGEHPADYEYPIADLTMSPSKEVPNYMTGPDMVGGKLYSDVIQRDTYYPRYRPDRWEPDELFTHVPPQIHNAFSDPSMRHTIPTMVGIAMRGMGNERETPMADSSLTDFSSRLSQNAVKRGLAVAHPGNREMESSGNNGIPPRTTTDLDPEWLEQVPDADVSAARHWVRSRIRGEAKPAPKKNVKRGDSQFEQLSLGI
jgi:hypothetical protein